jgi:hypothetical protein
VVKVNWMGDETGVVAIEGAWQFGYLEGPAKVGKEGNWELVVYRQGEKLKTYERCHLAEILPNDWVNPRVRAG